MPLRVLPFLLGMFLVAMTGCGGGGYLIEGKAIRGTFTSVSFVSSDDSRLAGPGLANIEVYVFRDPDSLGMEQVAKGVTNDQGDLYLPINAFGAGFLNELWLIYTYRPGFQSGSSITSLPKKKHGMRLLITLGPGIAKRPPDSKELFHQYEQFR